MPRPAVALTGVRETKRLFLLLDQEGRHVRGFIPKAGLAHLPPEVGVVRLIRDQIVTGRIMTDETDRAHVTS
jgi:hypothetical protein